MNDTRLFARQPGQAIPVPLYFDDDRRVGQARLTWTGVLFLFLVATATVGQLLTGGAYLSLELLGHMPESLSMLLLFVPVQAVLTSRGQFDFSVGSAAGLGAYGFVMVLAGSDNPLLAVGAALGFGLALGLVNTFFIVVLRLNSLLVTLATAVLGRVLLGFLLADFGGDYQVMNRTDYVPILLWVCAVAAVWVVWRYLREQRALPFLLTSVGAAVAGIGIADVVQTTSANAGLGWELNALLAAVAGAMWFSGNRPHLPIAILATVWLVMLNFMVPLVAPVTWFVLTIKAVVLLGVVLALWAFHVVMGRVHRRALARTSPPATE